MRLLLILIVIKSSSAQTAEDLFESLRVQFKQAAELNNIDLKNISYEYYDASDFLGPRYVQTYDFIVVGAGTAGSVVASRLSELPWFKVLLLEAGGVGDFLTDVPALAGFQAFGPHNWRNFAERQNNMGLGLKNQRMLWSRGKGLGGSSLINYMFHIRGNALDYDRWAEQGNPGWGYEDVLPYFKNSEDSRVHLEDVHYRNRGGKLTVEDVAYRSEAVHSFVEACMSLGYPYVDYNGANQLGVSYLQATTRDGLRCSGEKAFLRSARKRRNLVIKTNALVTKVLIDEKNVAHGVEFIRNGEKYKAMASREVILSAGVFNSPQILMLSGVGPRGHLGELGIKVKKDLPVGQKLYDHLAYPGLVFKAKQNIAVNLSAWEDPDSFVRLHKYASGPLTSAGGGEALAFIRTNVSTHPWEFYPDIELIFFGLSFSSDDGLVFARFLQISDEVYNTVYKPLQGQPVFSIIPVLLHPKSYGYLKLRSANPFDYPKLHGNFLTDPEGLDIKTFIAGIREARRICNTTAFRKFGVEEVTTPIPGCGNYAYDSDSYWECALRSIGVSVYHQVGTCKMGPASDPEAVVNARLQVHGVSNLRVIDSSVIPVTLSAHTNIPTYMVGEKGADILKQDWWLFT